MTKSVILSAIRTLFRKLGGVFKEVTAVDLGAEAIHQVMELGTNHPMGPLELVDLIGLDTCLSIMEVLYEGFYVPKYRPRPPTEKYVPAGYLGKKSGHVFYVYQR